jgi:hypothetical protein
MDIGPPGCVILESNALFDIPIDGRFAITSDDFGRGKAVAVAIGAMEGLTSVSKRKKKKEATYEGEHRLYGTEVFQQDHHLKCSTLDELANPLHPLHYLSEEELEIRQYALSEQCSSESSRALNIFGVECRRNSLRVGRPLDKMCLGVEEVQKIRHSPSVSHLNYVHLLHQYSLRQ